MHARTVYIYAISLVGCAFMSCVQGDILSRLRQAWMTSKPGFCWHRFAQHLSPTAIPHSPAQIAEQAASPSLIPKSLSRQPSVDNYTRSRQARLGCGACIGPDLTLAPSALRAKVRLCPIPFSDSVALLL